jgi:hypothetical protein
MGLIGFGKALLIVARRAIADFGMGVPLRAPYFTSQNIVPTPSQVRQGAENRISVPIAKPVRTRPTRN